MGLMTTRESTGLVVDPLGLGRHLDPGPDLGLGPHLDPGHTCRSDYRPHGCPHDATTGSHWMPT